jgi:hypothetical protein
MRKNLRPRRGSCLGPEARRLDRSSLRIPSHTKSASSGGISLVASDENYFRQKNSDVTTSLGKSVLMVTIAHILLASVSGLAGGVTSIRETSFSCLTIRASRSRLVLSVVGLSNSWIVSSGTPRGRWIGLPKIICRAPRDSTMLL